MPKESHIENFDWYLLVAVLLLCAFGVANLYSATRLSRPDLATFRTTLAGRLIPIRRMPLSLAGNMRAR